MHRLSQQSIIFHRYVLGPPSVGGSTSKPSNMEAAAIPEGGLKKKQAESASSGGLSEADVTQATELLGGAAMFKNVGAAGLATLVGRMEKKTYSKGEYIVEQGTATDRFWVMAEGHARRLRQDARGTKQVVDTKACGGTISSLSVAGGAATFATARCVTASCTAYTMSRGAFLHELRKHPAIAESVIDSLSAALRVKNRYKTPLLQQRRADVNYVAVSVAASVEAYYRSALNSVLNQRLSGVSSPYFPNMHVQIPVRVMYIAGFKGLRSLFDRNFDTEQIHDKTKRVTARVALTVAPGVVMTPISGILEASNAGHANPEPLMKRSFRGFLPRAGREIIFGIGLNQLSDYFEERYRNFFSNSLLANSAGSMTAGVVAGYLSHVPHNISTYRLLNPAESYRDIFRKFVDKSAPDKFVPKGLPDAMRGPLRTAMACLFPRGVVVRTVQICGSFVILNGVINLIEKDQERKMQRSLQADDDLILELDEMPSES